MNQLKNYDLESNTAEFDTSEGATVRRAVYVDATRDWPFSKAGRMTHAKAKPALLENELLVEEIGGRMSIIKTKD